MSSNHPLQDSSCLDEPKEASQILVPTPPTGALLFPPVIFMLFSNPLFLVFAPEGKREDGKEGACEDENCQNCLGLYDGAFDHGKS